MRGLPQELLFALLFGAVLLVQLLYRALRRKAASMREEPEAEVPPAAAASTPAPASPDTAARPAAARIAAPTPAPTRVAPRTLPRAHRYSRAALMPDRRAVQDAIVIAAILQPCHANRARDIE